MSEEAQAGTIAVAPVAADVAGASGGGSPNWTIPKNLTAMKLIGETKSIVIVRALVCAAVTAVMFVASVAVFGICLLLIHMFKDSGGGMIFACGLVLALAGGFFGFLRFVKTTVLYAIKAAHVAAITEYLRTGKAPVTEKGYKGVLAFGKEKISKNLGTTAVFFVFDRLVAASTRQIMRWVNKAQNLLSFIPGSEHIFKFVNFILSTALNFVDEAILSYVFYHSEDKRTFKKACDGLVYYAQSWKGMLMGAAKVAVFVWILRALTFVLSWAIVAFLIGLVASGLGGVGFIVGLIFAYVITYGIQTALVEPYATCMMLKDYHLAIAGQPLKADLHGQLVSVSKGFKDLFSKAKEEQPAGVEGAPRPEPVPAV